MSDQIEKLKPIQYQIITEICKMVENLGGGLECLAPIGSWGDTLTEEEVLSVLKELNE